MAEAMCPSSKPLAEFINREETYYMYQFMQANYYIALPVLQPTGRQKRCISVVLPVPGDHVTLTMDILN